MTQYIIEGQLLAEAPSSYATNTLFFICPKCGSHWATVFVEGTDFYPVRKPCRAHEWIGFVPGSIMTEIESARHRGPMDYHVSPEGMPPAVLKYELEVIMQAYEKGVFEWPSQQ